MSKKTTEETDVIIDVQEVYTKTETFIEDNKKVISIIAFAIIAVVALYFGYKKLYIAPMEVEAQSQLFMAEKYFEQDSLQKAMYGDGLNYGFIDIIADYSGTKSANLAHYYLGICYRNTGEYELAIDELKSFSSSDVMVSTVALGAIGDSYMELNDFENAIKYYEKAASHQENELTSPIYLFKAGLACEENTNYAEALENYTKIKEDYPDSREAQTIDKYIARAEALK
ncbi:MAG: tetratricopeptide repeat protein [Vicingus serpentipes]|nr:tetratricopeptide repeat protein [Vicingus serpentipes]